MAFDYKKEYREFYLPPRTPGLITVPAMNFLAVRGKGDPNEEGGAYKQALGMLYAVAFTIKMSKLGSHKLEGYFDYVVPPLEGLWWQEGRQGVDYARKDEFQWISLIRLPEFVTREAFDWALREAAEKKPLIGPSGRPRRRSIWTSPRWSSSPGRRGCASSVCTSAPMTMSPPPWRLWRNTPGHRGASWISARAGTTMRSI